MTTIRGTLKRRTEPTEGELKVLELVANGYQLRPVAQRLGIGHETAKDRVQRLKFLSGKQTTCGLVYWGLTNRLFELEYRRQWKPLLPMQVKIVSLLARDFSQGAIENQLFLTEDRVDNTIKLARKRMGAKSRPHLVAIAWTEGCIV